jgi:methyl-accepting chemotaxis protein
MASEAVDQARKNNDRVGELWKGAARMGDTGELINTIAGQTNLLAAAISGAARATPATPWRDRHEDVPGLVSTIKN